MNTDEFRTTLQLMLVNELKMWRHRFCNQTMLVFDFGCFPWHGYLELSFLTNDEPQMNVLSRDPELTAEWRLYDFTSTFSSKWPQTTDLANRMQKSYYSAPDRAEKAEAFFIASAMAVNSNEVLGVLSTYKRAADFEVRVFNPDDSSFKNYCKSI